MKRTIIGLAGLTALVFGVGYTIGQIGGVSSSLAATTTVTSPSVTIPATGGHEFFRADGIDAGGGFEGRADTPHADGTVTAINGDTLTISPTNDPNGTNQYSKVTTVVLTSKTVYESGPHGTTPLTRSAIKAGSRIKVTGTLSNNGTTITATTVGACLGGAGGTTTSSGPTA